LKLGIVSDLHCNIDGLDRALEIMGPIDALLCLGDSIFEYRFSNAVVEHLPDLESQRAFVAELCRVSRRVFVTTPNRWFPIDTHTLVPFAHWLPDERRDAVYRLLRRPEGLGLRLLSPAALLALFPPSVHPRLVRRGMTLVAVADCHSDEG